MYMQLSVSYQQEAQRCGLSLLIDAEESHRQPAVQLVARTLSRQLNSRIGSPAVYGTYQMYLRQTPHVLAADVALARELGYGVGAKLVRGAYLASERRREVLTGGSVLQPGKPATDAAYDCAVKELLAAAAGTGHVAVLLASHNTQSVLCAMREMQHLGLPVHHPGVHFAQIQGMADHLTIGLGDAGYNTHKLVPFGEFGDLLPWLLRRLQENKVRETGRREEA